MLDRLIAGGSDGPQRVYPCEYLEQAFGYAEDEARRILKGLADKALVELACYSSGAIAGASFTQDGKAYKEIRRMEAWDKWRKRLYGFIAGSCSLRAGGFYPKQTAIMIAPTTAPIAAQITKRQPYRGSLFTVPPPFLPAAGRRVIVFS